MKSAACIPVSELNILCLTILNQFSTIALLSGTLPSLLIVLNIIPLHKGNNAYNTSGETTKKRRRIENEGNAKKSGLDVRKVNLVILNQILKSQ